MPDWESATDLAALLKKWERDVKTYTAQIVEAKGKGLPHDQMFGSWSTLRECIGNLKNVQKRNTTIGCGRHQTMHEIEKGSE